MKNTDKKERFNIEVSDLKRSEQLLFCKHTMCRNPKENQENKCRLCGKPYKK